MKIIFTALVLLCTSCAEEPIQQNVEQTEKNRRAVSLPDTIPLGENSIGLSMNDGDRETLDEDDLMFEDSGTNTRFAYKVFSFMATQPHLMVKLTSFPRKGLGFGSLKMIVPLIQIYDENHKAIQIQKLITDRASRSSEDGNCLERVWELDLLETKRKYSIVVFSDHSLIGSSGVKASLVPPAFTESQIHPWSGGVETKIAAYGPFKIELISK